MNTKKIVLAALVVFGGAILIVALYGVIARRNDSLSRDSKTALSTSTYTLAAVQEHATLSDCWMVIGEDVLDVTSYISEHPTAPDVIGDYCGKDASKAYETKGGRGRAHSPYADQLLQRYTIGKLAR